MSLGEFTFFFVRCDDLEEQTKWIQRLQERLPQRQIQHIELKHQEDSLLLYLRRNPISESTEAICITGLEKSISSIYDLWSENFLRDLNLRRNSFYDEFPKPMIFIGNLYFQKKIMIHAPDFFSIRSSIFYFSNTKTPHSDNHKMNKINILYSLYNNIFTYLTEEFILSSPEVVRHSIMQAIHAIYNDNEDNLPIELTEEKLRKLGRMNLVYNIKNYHPKKLISNDDELWTNNNNLSMSEHEKQRSIISSLNIEDLKIFYLKKAGFSEQEIAKKLLTTRKHISFRLLRIRQKFSTINV